MNQEKQKIIEYFRSNIFQAKSSYIQWKMIFGARSTGIVGNKMANRYLEIQKNYPNFFVLTEASCQMTFVTLICHVFDKREDSMSFEKLGKEDFDNFVETNNDVIKKLKKFRHKLIAHRDLTIDPKDILIPSIQDIDAFFINLEELYNHFSSKIDNSNTLFINADDLKNEIEILYMSIERGEQIRKKEIDIKYLWEDNPDKISNKI